MKRTVYRKMLLSFLPLLILSEILVVLVYDQQIFLRISQRMTKILRSQQLLIRVLFQEWGRRIRPEQLKSFKPLQLIADRKFRDETILNIWVTDKSGTRVFFSTGPKIPRAGGKLLFKKGHMIVRQQQDGRLVAVMDVPFNRNRGLLFHVYLQKKPLLIQEFGFLLIFAVIQIVVVSSLILIPVSMRITSPLQKLSSAAHRIAAGVLDVRAEVHGDDEIGRLAQDFNRMAGVVQKMVEGSQALTASISHELRTPLARMRISHQMLAELPVLEYNPKAEKQLLRIEHDIEEMDQLIGDILQLTRAGLVINDADVEAFDMLSVLYEISEKESDRVKQLGAAFKITAEQQPLFFRLPRRAYYMVCSNVIENMIRYAEPGSELTIDVRHSNKSGLELRFSNKSAPLDAAELEKLTQPFYRSAVHKKNAAGGSGLGLSIVSTLVAGMGGTMSLEYNGDRFILKLRFAAGD